MKKAIFLLLLFFLSIFIYGQENKIDSLTNLIKKHHGQDSIKVSLLIDLSHCYLYEANSENLVNYSNEAIELSEKIGYKYGKARAFQLLGIYYSLKSNYEKALSYFNQSILIFKTINYSVEVAQCLSGIGIIYEYQSNLPLAFEYYLKALKIYIKTGNKGLISDALIDIGVIYDYQENSSSALYYYKTALILKKGIKDYEGMSVLYNNIGLIYGAENKTDTAIVYFNKALQIAEKSNNKTNISNPLINLGKLYNNKQQPDKALEYINKALKINKEIENKKDIAIAEYFIGKSYFLKGNFNKSLFFIKKSLIVSKELKLTDIEKDCYNQLSKIFSKKNDYKKAYINHVLYKQLYDSIFNIKRTNKITEIGLKYQYEKEKEKIFAEQQKKDALNKKEIKYQKTLKRIFIISLIIAVILIIIFIRIIRINKKTQKKLLNKNIEIEAQNYKIKEQKDKIQAQSEELYKHRIFLEEMIAERTYELIKSKRKAEESDKLKTEFLNNISHEVRTPLNAILGFSDIIINKKISNDRQNYFIKLINKSGIQLLNIIDNIIEMSKVSSEKNKRKKENVICLNELLTEHSNAILSGIKEKNIKIKVNKSLPDDESYIISNKSKLNVIIKNLLNNAEKFTFKGYIELGYNITDDNTLNIYVKDTGIGINEKNYQTVFLRFSQEEKDISQKTGGLGLGLAIAQKNAQHLYGKITLKSKKGEGSTFTLSIPYKKAQKKKIISSVKKKTENKNEYTILIAEDNELNFLVIKTILKNINLNTKIIHAENGLDAVNYCKQNSNIDIVLMDLMMPVMDGFEATKKIKSFLPDLPVVIQTAYVSEKEREKAFLAGCDDFISKPINEKRLKKVISEFI